MEAGTLINLTHDEEPWTNTENKKTINTNKIKEYFNKVYEQWIQKIDWLLNK